VVYPGEDGWWVAKCLSLPICVNQGNTKEEAREYERCNPGYIDALEEDNLVIRPDNFDALIVAV
jgi:predicted RNase H-like HicB family nuclease